MKISTSVAVLLTSAFALVGCKSEIEKYADEVCECKDMECVQKLSDKYKDKVPQKKPEELKDMSEADKKALAKAIECSLKHIEIPK